MKKVIYVLSLYNCSKITDGYDGYEVLSAYDSVEEAEKGILNYYNNYITLNYNTLIANTIEEMEICLDEINFCYEINDVHYYTK